MTSLECYYFCYACALRLGIYWTYLRNGSDANVRGVQWLSRVLFLRKRGFGFSSLKGATLSKTLSSRLSTMSTGSTQKLLKTVDWDVNSQIKDCFSLANSADHDEMTLNATFDLGVTVFKIHVCLFDLVLCVPSTIFQL